MWRAGGRAACEDEGLGRQRWISGSSSRGEAKDEVRSAKALAGACTGAGLG